MTSFKNYRVSKPQDPKFSPVIVTAHSSFEARVDASVRFGGSFDGYIAVWLEPETVYEFVISARHRSSGAKTYLRVVGGFSTYCTQATFAIRTGEYFIPLEAATRFGRKALDALVAERERLANVHDCWVTDLAIEAVEVEAQVEAEDHD